MEPWALRKTDPGRAASSLNTLCEWLLWLARWMAPFMPGKAQELWEMLGQPGRVVDQHWPGSPEASTWRQLENGAARSEEHTSELQSRRNLVCRLLLEKKNQHTR